MVKTLDTINGRTPEEIKKGLECCTDICDEGCDVCVYDSQYNRRDKLCLVRLKIDALALIRKLERERDAAVEDIFHMCANCKHEKLGYGVGPCPPIEEYLTNDCSNWQWRGAQEVE